MKSQKMNEYKTGYSFIEFLAAEETEIYGGSFNEIDPKWLEFYKGFLRNVGEYMVNESIHMGDCCKAPQTCTLCMIEDELRNYYNYVYRPDVWMYGDEPVTVKLLKKFGFKPILLADEVKEINGQWYKDGIILYQSCYSNEFNFATRTDENGDFKSGFRISTLSQLNNIYKGLTRKDLKNE